MTTYDKLMLKILSGRQDRSISFSDLRKLVLSLGFDERIKGDHHIYYRAGVEEIINLQPAGDNAKPYQVKQVREIITKYKLSGGDNDV